MPNDSQYIIDIDKVLKEKAPNKHIPKLLLSYLKHIAHQEDLNRDFLRANGDAMGVDFVNRALNYLDVKVKVKNEENLPKDGKVYTFVSNHPLGAQDGLILS